MPPFQNGRFGIWGVAFTGILLVISGCSSKVDANEALANVRAKIDGKPQCAALLSGTWPIEFSSRVLSGKTVDSLVAAGLIKRITIDGDPDLARTRIELTKLGQEHVMIISLDENTPKYAVLCYGKRKVISANYEQGNTEAAQNAAKDGGTLMYDFRIDQSPQWTTRADIRAAFPFMVRDIEQAHRERVGAAIDEPKYFSPATESFFSPVAEEAR